MVDMVDMVFQLTPANTLFPNDQNTMLTMLTMSMPDMLIRSAGFRFAR